MESPILLAVPNVSEGRHPRTIAAIASAFAQPGEVGGRSPLDPGVPPADGVRLLDVHSDADHHRSVFTVAGRQAALADAVLAGARAAVDAIDVMARARGEAGQTGQHPHVGALDVLPIVYLDHAERGSACAEALVIADRIGRELELPVFLYGELSAGDRAGERTRAELRRGGIALLTDRIAAARGQDPTGRQTAAISDALEAIRPDFGPHRMHPTAGATLVAARPPLVAFNLLLAAPATFKEARAIAGLIREGGAEGLPGLRAIGIELTGGRAQVSMNVERPLEVPLAMVIEAVGRHAKVHSAELVGLAPRAALEGFPPEVPMPGFDPARHVIENAIGW
jgi:glutamate formiminotransferase/glutamate formiminotransferase/formiminotetrahydrofolate cyclodeaminase